MNFSPTGPYADYTVYLDFEFHAGTKYEHRSEVGRPHRALRTWDDHPCCTCRGSVTLARSTPRTSRVHPVTTGFRFVFYRPFRTKLITEFACEISSFAPEFTFSIAERNAGLPGAFTKSYVLFHLSAHRTKASAKSELIGRSAGSTLSTEFSFGPRQAGIESRKSLSCGIDPPILEIRDWPDATPFVVRQRGPSNPDETYSRPRNLFSC